MTDDEIKEAAEKFTKYLIANGLEDVAVMVRTKTLNFYSMNVTPLVAINSLSGLVAHLLELEGGKK